MKYKTLTAPLSTQIEITNLCNQKCQHCYNFWRQSNIGKEEILNEQQIVKIVSTLAKKKVFGIVFTGGEPLLNKTTKSTTMRGIKEASKYNIWTSVNTNLTTISKDDALKFKEVGLGSILTSLLSFDPKTHNEIVQVPNSFEKVIKGIKTAVSVGIPVNVSMVLLKLNRNHIYETGRLASNLGAKSFNITRVVPPLGCSKKFSRFIPTKKEILESLEILLELKKKFGLKVGILEPYPYCLLAHSPNYHEFTGGRCTAGILTCAISSTGDVRPCPHINKTYGNIFKQPFSKIWIKMTEWRTGIFLPKECTNCKIIEACGGGCRVNAFYKRGEYNNLDPLVSLRMKSYVENLLKRANEKTTFKTARLPRIMSLHPAVKFRKESFGGIVGLGPRRAVFLKKGSYLVTLKLKKYSAFSIKDIVGLYGITRKEVASLLTTLFVKNIIIEKKGGKN